MADIPFGDVAPSGPLPTFPAADDQHPAAGDPLAYKGRDGVVRYTEELQVGCRWWQSQRQVPLFPFGHGLTYTDFEYGGLAIETDCDDVVVPWTMRNIGDRRGREEAQLNLGYPATAGEPPLQLRALHDPVLDAGAAVQPQTRLSARDRRHWDSANQQWPVAPGGYLIAVGASSSDLRQHATVILGR